jgi:hypothetical protein
VDGWPGEGHVKHPESTTSPYLRARKKTVREREEEKKKSESERKKSEQEEKEHIRYI